jgi:hypothetical protein
MIQKSIVLSLEFIPSIRHVCHITNITNNRQSRRLSYRLLLTLEEVQRRSEKHDEKDTKVELSKEEIIQ